jgi:hypothetical protein
VVAAPHFFQKSGTTGAFSKHGPESTHTMVGYHLVNLEARSRSGNRLVLTGLISR